MTTARTAPSRRRQRRLVATVVATVVTTASVAISGCSFDRDEPATVTMPEKGTTTSTVPPTLAPDSGAPDTGGSSAVQDVPPALAWSVQIGGAGDDVLRSVTDSQASVVAVGSTAAGIADPTSGGPDVLSTTVTTDGTVESVDQFGSDSADDATAVASTQESVLACGSTTGALGAAANGGSSDAWCAPLPATPDRRVGQLGGPETEQITGLSLPRDVARSSEVGTGAGYASGAIDGFFPGAEDPAGQGLGGGDALAFRVGADGSAIWTRQFGTPTEDASTAVCAVDADGVFVGYTDGDLEGRTKGARDGWISRIDETGVQRWITQFGSTGNDEFRAVATSGEARRGTEQFVAVGSTDGDIDADGPLANSGAQDAMITAFGSDGSTLWATQLGGELADSATAVVADGSTVYVAGTTQTVAVARDGTTAQIGLGELDPSVGPGGLADGFLAALDATTGEVRWIVRLGTAQDESVTGMTTTEDGLLVISGSTGGQIADTPPAGGLDGFLLAFPLPSSGGGAANSV